MSSVGESGASKESCFNRIPWLPILRVLGGCLGILIIVLGIIGIVTTSFSPRSFVDDCYQVLFGLLIVLAELRFERALRFFSFLCSYAGLGLFYIFVGGLALGGEWYNYVLAVCFLAIGIVYTGMGCCYRKQMYPPKEEVSNKANNNLAPEQRPLTPAAAFGQSTHMSNVVASAATRAAVVEQTPDSAWPDDDRV